MTEATRHPSLIGGIGLTEVHVYSQRPAPDGLFSGCPHVHAVTDEGYFVLSGQGWVEFHDRDHGCRRLDLAPGDYVHFPPLVMHRLVSTDALVILGIMGNGGLAERGEARIYFGPEVDASPTRFVPCSALIVSERTPEATMSGFASMRGGQFFQRPATEIVHRLHGLTQIENCPSWFVLFRYL